MRITMRIIDSPEQISIPICFTKSYVRQNITLIHTYSIEECLSFMCKQNKEYEYGFLVTARILNPYQLCEHNNELRDTNEEQERKRKH